MRIVNNEAVPTPAAWVAHVGRGVCTNVRAARDVDTLTAGDTGEDVVMLDLKAWDPSLVAVGGDAEQGSDIVVALPREALDLFAHACRSPSGVVKIRSVEDDPTHAVIMVCGSKGTATVKVPALTFGLAAHRPCTVAVTELTPTAHLRESAMDKFRFAFQAAGANHTARQGGRAPWVAQSFGRVHAIFTLPLP